MIEPKQKKAIIKKIKKSHNHVSISQRKENQLLKKVKQFPYFDSNQIKIIWIQMMKKTKVVPELLDFTNFKLRTNVISSFIHQLNIF